QDRICHQFLRCPSRQGPAETQELAFECVAGANVEIHVSKMTPFGVNSGVNSRWKTGGESQIHKKCWKNEMAPVEGLAPRRCEFRIKALLNSLTTKVQS